MLPFHNHRAWQMQWSMLHKFYIVTFALFTGEYADVQILQISHQSYSAHHLVRALHAESQKRVMKKKKTKNNTLCLYLIQKWCKCKCSSVGRCESNFSQFWCRRPFSILKISFLVDMILLGFKSCHREAAMGMEMVKITCLGKDLFIHMMIVQSWAGEHGSLLSVRLGY